VLRLLPSPRKPGPCSIPERPEIPGQSPIERAPGAIRSYDPRVVNDSRDHRAASTFDRMAEHADSLFNLARHLTGHDGDAEDLVQETFVRALRATPRVEDEPNLKAWLYRVLRNIFYDSYRRRVRRRETESVDEELAAPNVWLRDDAELELLRGLVGREIEAAMARLTEESRTVILLDVEGFTEQEIAGVMECPVGTVKSRLMRARASLRKVLSHYAK
jgi:RNA polymerase sigma-70 factor (ECF subfamily)